MATYDGRLISKKLSGSDLSSYSIVDQKDGSSAYDIAVNNGFVGTVSEWLTSLATAGSSYSHTQSTASSSWYIIHNLGFYPNISTFDQDNNEIRGQVIHHSISEAEVQFITPRAGLARLS